MDPGEKEIFIAILLASGILGIIIVYFITIIVRNGKRYFDLQRTQLNTQITALEIERKRIISDLHDDLGPLLAALKFHLSNLDVTLNRDQELIGKANNNLDDVLLRIREICNHMTPEILTRKGLFTAINDFIEELNSPANMEIIFTCHPMPVTPQAELHIYRMIQEITGNAIKHSGANELRIDIGISNKNLVLNICDNGRGFDIDSVVNKNHGLGIKNIFGRTTILNGHMYLTSAPGKGTKYLIEIPIPCNEPQDTTDDRRRS